MTELPDEMKTTLTNLDTSLTALEEHLDPIFEIPWDVLTARLEPMEKAKLNLMMAYSTASLFYMYLKSQGISTEDHPVQSELARIHSYIGKLKEVTGNAEKEKARLRLNKDAAERFIKGSLSRKSRGEGEMDDEGEVEGGNDKDGAKPPPGKKANKSR